mmetsp:Transcript_11044/g.24534  ORF Transcript_11044/g.24534 Transcript_11044/m.24534 type:complete len:963 (-) Transcript_11044:107-2995(-)
MVITQGSVVLPPVPLDRPFDALIAALAEQHHREVAQLYEQIRHFRLQCTHPPPTELGTSDATYPVEVSPAPDASNVAAIELPGSIDNANCKEDPMTVVASLVVPFPPHDFSTPPHPLGSPRGFLRHIDPTPQATPQLTPRVSMEDESGEPDRIQSRTSVLSIGDCAHRPSLRDASRAASPAQRRRRVSIDEAPTDAAQDLGPQVGSKPRSSLRKQSKGEGFQPGDADMSALPSFGGASLAVGISSSLGVSSSQTTVSNGSQFPKTRRLQALSAKIVSANKTAHKFSMSSNKFAVQQQRLRSNTSLGQNGQLPQDPDPFCLNGEQNASGRGQLPMARHGSGETTRTNGTCASADAELEGRDLQLRAVFRRESEVSPSRLANVRQWTSKTSAFQEKAAEDSYPIVAYDGVLRHFISTPTASHRVAWEAAGAVLIAFDMLFVPMSIIFSPPEERWMAFLSLFSLAYWTLNIPASLCVGVIVDGVLIMEPRRILKRYAMTWMGIDLIVVIPEWIFTTMSVGGDSDTGQFVKLLRMWRLFRTARLLRILRLRWILEVLTDLLQTELLGITVNIAKMITVMFLLCHYVGCCWYLLGNSTKTQPAGSWVSWHDHSGVQWLEFYLLSVHWAMAQFTPASMEIQPRNEIERAYCVLIIMFALVCFSYVVGSITASLGQLRSLNEDFAKNSWVARRYLRQHDVPTHLNIRIMRYLEKRYERQRSHVHMDSIKIFSLLSEYLNSELQSAVYLPHLKNHALFAYMQGDKANQMNTMQRLAAKAITRKILAGGDFLFVQYDQQSHMGVLLSGKLIYAKVDSRNFESEEAIQKSHCILEHVLWTDEWICLGEASAATDCEIQMLSADAFCDIVQGSALVRHFITRYAQAFIKALNAKHPDEITDFWRSEDIAELAGPVIQDFEAEMSVKSTQFSKYKRAASAAIGLVGLKELGSRTQVYGSQSRQGRDGSPISHDE